jgi:hypothetical protein
MEAEEADASFCIKQQLLIITEFSIWEFQTHRSKSMGMAWVKHLSHLLFHLITSHLINSFID